MVTVLLMVVMFFLLLGIMIRSWAKFFSILAIIAFIIGVVVVCILYERSWGVYRQRGMEMMRFMNYFNSSYYFSKGVRWSSSRYGAWLSAEYGLGDQYQAYHDPDEPFRNFNESFNFSSLIDGKNFA